MPDLITGDPKMSGKEFNKLSPKQQEIQSYANVIQFITNTFYRTKENKPISIVLTKNGNEYNFYDQHRIVLSINLMEQFKKLNLPRFTVYYHELGHHLYSIGSFRAVEKWMKIKQGPIAYHKKYDHLNNWIEDFYIENKLLQDHSYLTDVLTCIKKLPPEYPINKIEYAFNYFYVNGAPSPAMQYTDQITFLAYIKKLLSLREDGSTRFGSGIVSNLAIKTTKETKYFTVLIEFYNWCVSKKILPKNQPLPKMQNPNNHLKPSGNSGGSGQNTNANGQGNGKGYSDHSKKVGHSTVQYTEAPPVSKATTLFKEELTAEAKLINKNILDMSQRIDTSEQSLDGLFSTKYKESAIIQPKVIVNNFFQPYRLLDQVLFKEKLHTYMNVAVYRDISGSTKSCHTLMEKVVAQLHKDIPVNITYYLYASGKISIVEVPYIPWYKRYDQPKEYINDPLVQQMQGGTNSDAIADVITEQLSDKWLNIIITDGDLDRLATRKNINALLKNVFVVAVDTTLSTCNAKGTEFLGVEVNDESDLIKINPVLSTINLQST